MPQQTSIPRKLALHCLLLSTVLIYPAHASSPMEHTKSVLEQARAIIDSSKSHDEQLSDLKHLLRSFLDTSTMGRTALADHGKTFTDSQRAEFLTLFEDLFQRTYVQKLLLFDKPNFAYVTESQSGNQFIVETKILTPKDEFAVSYVLRAEGDRWLATDIRIEEMSLVRNFQRQLDRLLNKSNPAELLVRMRKKYGPGGKGEDGDL